jgi:hypothetical protein
MRHTLIVAALLLIPGSTADAGSVMAWSCQSSSGMKAGVPTGRRLADLANRVPLLRSPTRIPRAGFCRMPLEP